MTVTRWVVAAAAAAVVVAWMTQRRRYPLAPAPLRSVPADYDRQPYE